MQYRDELLVAACDAYTATQKRRAVVLNTIQMHAVNQIKEGYTGFRINKLKKSDEIYLEEWVRITNAKMKIVKFRCFNNAKRYMVKQFLIDMKESIGLEYDLEGKTLIIEE